MFECERCSAVFEEWRADVYADVLDVIDGRPYVENIYVCPECGSDDLERIDDYIYAENILWKALT